MVIEMNTAKTILLAVLLVFFGRYLRKKIPFLVRWSLPEAVVGGTLFAILTLILYQLDLVKFKFDTSLQSFFMQLFFTASGFEASGELIKKSSGKLVVFIILAAVLAVLQNAIAVGMSPIVGLDPKLGLMCGSIPLTGGHGNAAAYAPLAEDAGVTGAVSVAVAAATYGLAAGSIIGGPVATRLIKKYNLATPVNTEKAEASREAFFENQADDQVVLDKKRVALASAMIFIGLGIGAYLADLFKILFPSLTLPVHVMGMIGGAIVRNVYDAIKGTSKATPAKEIDIFGSVCLSIFVSMAVMSMALWDLIALAIPLILILAAETVATIIFTYFVTFKAMGSDYDAAVMAGGHIGFGMGAVPASMANMTAVCSVYGFSKLAFIIVPVVGGMFSNFTNAANITFFMNLVGIQ